LDFISQIRAIHTTFIQEFVLQAHLWSSVEENHKNSSDNLLIVFLSIYAYDISMI
jgi:hypothetical protein